MEYKRKDIQTKRILYRRLAQMRKNNWATQHKFCDDENIKSHFTQQEEFTSTEDFKTKKIVKGDQRNEQKLRNRAAAQESRERHRLYVEELEKKVKMYEDLFEKQGALCKNCKKHLLNQANIESQTIAVEEYSHQNSSSNLLNSSQSQDYILDSYLNDQIVRIDNKGASSPFGIFFIVCLIGVLAVFSLGSSDSNVTPRLLANYHSTVNQLLQMQGRLYQQNEGLQISSKLLQIDEMQNPENWQVFEQQVIEKTLLPTPSLELNQNVSKNWTNYGDYVCSQPSFIMKNKALKEKKGLEFLLLRTGRNTSKPVKKLKVTLDEKQGHRINIQANEWQDLQLSSCFRKDL